MSLPQGFASYPQLRHCLGLLPQPPLSPASEARPPTIGPVQCQTTKLTALSCQYYSGQHSQQARLEGAESQYLPTLPALTTDLLGLTSCGPTHKHRHLAFQPWTLWAHPVLWKRVEPGAHAASGEDSLGTTAVPMCCTLSPLAPGSWSPLPGLLSLPQSQPQQGEV